jgi:glycosyltransferase involved in cell wall biosynthesis
MSKIKLSVVLSTYNEESNIGPCLESVKSIADEMIVFDEYSSDKTREIAKNYGAQVYKFKHKYNFHETKQAAIEKATGDWILQLDADERVSPELAKEILEVINSSDELLITRKADKLYSSKHNALPTKHIKLFIRHQQLIEQRSGQLGKPAGEVVAFFIPRLNYFLGEPLKHAGVYPDGVIRLFKKGKARLPAKSVHELMEVEGDIGWLFCDLEHHESPTFKRYLERANRYTDYTALQYKKDKVPASPLFMIHYSVFKPASLFLNLYIRHKGFLDGFRGFIWSLFSALHLPFAYFKYYSNCKNSTNPS